MPKIKLSHPSGQKPQDAYSKVKAMMTSDPDLKKLDPNCQFQFNDQTCSGTSKGKMFTAEFKVDSAGVVEMTVDLAFMLTPAKAMVEKTLEKKLKAVLEGA